MFAFRVRHIERHLKGTVKGNKLKYLNKTFGDWFVLHQVKKHSPFREKFEMKLSRLSLPRSKDSFTLAYGLSMDSAVDCVNAEIENFISLCGNVTFYCGIYSGVNEPLTILMACC